MKTLGIIGGMGPAATADFLAKIVAHTAAIKDDDHVPCVVINDPRIPDRTDAFLEGREAEVLGALTARLQRLEDAGVDGVAIPCNSAHHWADALQARARAPLLHIADASLKKVQVDLPHAHRIALMATPVTYRSGFYQRRMQARGLIHHEIADALLLEKILPGIRAVKAGETQIGASLLSKAASQILEGGAEAVLMACTEIPIALADHGDARLVDTNAALAAACVAWARGDA